MMNLQTDNDTEPAEPDDPTSETFDESIAAVKTQLSVIRNAVRKLRHHMKNLNYSQQRQIIENLQQLIKTTAELRRPGASPRLPDTLNPAPCEEADVNFKYIGKISTCFSRKRGIPRQPGICIDNTAELALHNAFFANPEHALVGLKDFSHLWVIFHFHRNDSIHVRPKVAPPRLNGMKTGVFSTRSPHRPSPIGLSLVRIDRIEGASIFFSGVDMLDGTPVIDIKPYIPSYDDPVNLVKTPCNGKDVSATHVESMETCSDATTHFTPGEMPADVQTSCFRDNQPPPSQIVRVPAWILESPVSKLSVEFDESAKVSLDKMELNTTAGDPIEIITKILQEDPRSTYLREKYANETIYSFQVGPYQVSVRFDDVNRKVFVYNIDKLKS